MLVRHGPGAESGLIVLANYAHADDRVSAYRDMGMVGVVDRGLWPAGPYDRTGILFLYSRQSAWLRRHLDRAGLGPAPTHTTVLEA